MKRILLWLLGIALIVGAGFVAFVYLVPEIKEIVGEIRKGIIEQREREQRIAELRRGLEHIDYSSGDTTPEHLAEVLGSWERYEKLRDSPLLKPIWISPEEQGCSMEIVYDITRKGPIYWVYMIMRGEVVKIEGRVITITNEGETISLYVPEWAIIETDEVERVVDEKGKPVYKNGYPVYRHVEAKFEDIKVGDWLSHIHVFINANTYPGGEARSIMIAT
ncbi:hypothetical protein M1N58_01765 [Dehalococcoidales bacterium]|nr:hypothetical protein [Dehalococcoidales bacterium]